MSDSEESGFLLRQGHYQTLLSFEKAEVVYDLTFRFAHKYLSKGDRTIDQMIQSARSGKKNILEGSKASVTSKEMEIKLTGVPGPALKNCWMIIGITCARGILLSGKKTPAKPNTYASWGGGNRRITKSIGSFLKPARQRSLQTLPSASSTKQTIC